MKNIRILIAFALFCFAGIAGIPTWPKRDTTVGYFMVGKNPYGIAIYQEGTYASIQFTHARSFTVKKNIITISPASTITYSRDDIIFDAQGTIYTEPTQAEIDVLSDILQIHAVKTTQPERIIHLPVKSLYLVNPKIPGMLVFQNNTLSVDRDTKTITVENPVSVAVYDSVSL